MGDQPARAVAVRRGTPAAHPRGTRRSARAGAGARRTSRCSPASSRRCRSSPPASPSSQLQTSRVFWVLELLGTLMLVWMVAEAAAARRRAPAWCWRRCCWRRAPGARSTCRPSSTTTAPSSPSTSPTTTGPRRCGGLAPTFAGAHVLADPGHAWSYGKPVRVGAGRDVLLEEVKDVDGPLRPRDGGPRPASASGRWATSTRSPRPGA